MTVRVTKPAFNVRDKLSEIGANIAISQMPSGTIINTAYSEYSTEVVITTTGQQKYATIWTPHIVARESGSDFLVMSHIQGYKHNSPNGVNLGIQRVVDDAWITLADEIKNDDAAGDDQWMGLYHGDPGDDWSFNINRFAMDTYRTYKAGQKIEYDICTGFWATSGSPTIKVNYGGYSSQCVAFIMEIKQ